MFDFSGKTSVITGGGSGIGQAVANLFARQGAEVIILDVNEKGAGETVAAIRASGGKGEFFRCDVSDQGNVNNLINELPSLDILVNSAGVSHIGSLDTTSEADFDRLFRINVKGVYNTMQASVRKMKESGGGVILNLCSVAATVGIPDRFAYSMTKGAVLSMTLSVARDYLQHNIRCNCISPGRVHTPFVDDFLKKNYPGQEKEMFQKLSSAQPIGRMGTPAEMASLILFLCSDEAAFVTGTDYAIDGGFTHLK
jgi:NAD(P)-dependent dehydrogenase (short-subunit alcohol dehydrogenase family)